MATSKIQSEKTLLWTNPSTTSDFSAQSISLDMSKYHFALILFYEYKDASRHSVTPVVAPVGETGITATCTYTMGNMGYSVRGFSVYKDRVEFGVAKNQSIENNGQCIPYRIYGIY